MCWLLSFICLICLPGPEVHLWEIYQPSVRSWEKHVRKQKSIHLDFISYGHGLLHLQPIFSFLELILTAALCHFLLRVFRYSCWLCVVLLISRDHKGHFMFVHQQYFKLIFHLSHQTELMLSRRSSRQWTQMEVINWKVKLYRRNSLSIV